MKKSILAIAIILSLALVSCDPAGTTYQRLNGSEDGLPEELKGLKVYNVSTGSGSDVKVAILNNEVNSVTYKQGKHAETTIMVNCNEGTRTVEGTILSETDSIIVIKKK